MRHAFLLIFVGLSLGVAALGLWDEHFWWGLALTGPLSLLALRDYFQTHHTILRNFPVLGHMRYLAESVRPGVQQYFIENESDGRPFSKEQRSIVYQRSRSGRSTTSTR